MKPWISHPRLPSPRDLHEVRDAAHDLADQAGHAPGRPGTVFQTVYSVALLATVVLSGALAGVHLYKTLFPRQREGRHEGPTDHRPEPRHRAAHTTAHEHGHAR